MVLRHSESKKQTKNIKSYHRTCNHTKLHELICTPKNCENDFECLFFYIRSECTFIRDNMTLACCIADFNGKYVVFDLLKHSLNLQHLINLEIKKVTFKITDTNELFKKQFNHGTNHHSIALK